MSENCVCKTKHREEKEYTLLKNRLKRIEGQVRGLQKMLDEEAYCTDILTQVSAVQAALNSFNKELLENHINSCVIDGIKAGDEEVVKDLVKTVQKLMK